MWVCGYVGMGSESHTYVVGYDIWHVKSSYLLKVLCERALKVVPLVVVVPPIAV
jgi:hypothetical protein